MGNRETTLKQLSNNSQTTPNNYSELLKCFVSAAEMANSC